MALAAKGDRVRITIETTVEDIDRYAGGGYDGMGLNGRLDVLYSNRHTLEIPPFADRLPSDTTVVIEVLS